MFTLKEIVRIKINTKDAQINSRHRLKRKTVL